ncbi:SUMF1/EgtB/PvdO family nonheme iron enzyme [Accumulibacter sp.]|uniref:SUMF1/EgtB/PvdO family nonheme iron enzyme n=1 Tax=Accumulibacter sp. TaxID=2053492 RepID=UPI00261D12CF|nr:SUMF1/EgtB/PvdO family nonheme iron enzyme [Accumulibacter sp.]
MSRRPAFCPGGSSAGDVPGEFVAGALRVLRGGSWNNSGRNVRSAQRNRNEPGKRNDNVGFRLALAPESRRPAQDQMNFLSAARRRQKAHALRQAGRRDAEGLPKRRLAEFR